MLTALLGRDKSLSHKKFEIFKDFCSDLGGSPSQILLAWGLSNKRTIAIPKVSSISHLKENIASTAFKLSTSDADYISNLFLPTSRKVTPRSIIPHIPVKEDQRNIYRNLSDAKNNIYNLTPGPVN